MYITLIQHQKARNIALACVALLFIAWLYKVYFWHRKGNKTDPDREQKIISEYMCAGKYI